MITGSHEPLTRLPTSRLALLCCGWKPSEASGTNRPPCIFIIALMVKEDSSLSLSSSSCAATGCVSRAKPSAQNAPNRAGHPREVDRDTMPIIVFKGSSPAYDESRVEPGWD